MTQMATEDATQHHHHDHNHHHSDDPIRDVRELCKQKGARWTMQRQIILDVLQRTSGHVSADDIYSQIKDAYPAINVSTIYRNLEMLSDLDVLVKVHDATDGIERFELRGGDSHHHVVCQNCGLTIEIGDETLTSFVADIQARYGFALKPNHILGYGLCQACQTQHPTL